MASNLESKLNLIQGGIDDSNNLTKAIFNGGHFYKEIEWIRSTGTYNTGQYIDTGVKGSNLTKIEIKISNTITATAAGDVLGSRSSNTSTDSILLGFYYGGWIHWGGNDEAFTDIRNKTSTVLIDKNKSYIYNDSTSQFDLVNTYNDITFETPDNLLLFASRERGLVGAYVAIDLYYCKIWEDDVLVRDFIPVIDYDGIACLYDRVSQTFFYNQGTGSFTVPSSTSTYTELEYIETTGNNYIQLGTASTATVSATQFDIDFMLLDNFADVSTTKYVFGRYYANTSTVRQYIRCTIN